MMHLNLIHRSQPGVLGEFVRRQQDLAHRENLKTTFCIQYAQLFEDDCIAAIKEDRDRYGDEIALGLHRMAGPDTDELLRGNNSFWLFSKPQKRAVLTKLLAQYRKVFGESPRSVGCYHMDASSLKILRELSPETEVVIGGCFEEGVRVFHGCNNSWYLFNEGMPWGPWYPSKSHALRPAQDEDDAVGVIAIPHLMRDMSLAFEDRNDFFASHPPNVMRGMANFGSYCPYDRNLVDQFRIQARYNNGNAYYNSFVGAGWLSHNKVLEVPPIIAWELYEKFIGYLSELKRAGELKDMTMREYGQWYRQSHPLGKKEPDIYWAKEMLYGSGKHYIWYADESIRLLIDAGQGGSIGDLRPYIAEVPVETGSDTKHLAMGSYPYIIQSQHRTGFAHHHRDGSRTTLMITHDGETVDAATCRTKCKEITREDGVSIIELEPIKVSFTSGVDVTVGTCYRVKQGGHIVVERRILKSSTPDAKFTFREWFKGCYGYTEYPEDLRGAMLVMHGKEKTDEIPFEYEGRSLESQDCKAVSARIPQVNTEIKLSPETGGVLQAGIVEGYLFNPYYALFIDYHLKEGDLCRTSMSLKSIK